MTGSMTALISHYHKAVVKSGKFVLINIKLQHRLLLEIDIIFVHVLI